MLRENGNKEAEFDVSKLTAFTVNVAENSADVVENGKNVVENVVDDARKVVKGYSAKLTDRQITILEIMAQQPSVSATEMSQRLSFSPRTIQRDISELKELGILDRVGGDKGGKWKIVFPKKNN